MNKRDRLEKTLIGEPTDRVAVSLWRHWPGDDQRAGDFARSVIEFQKRYDWDFVTAVPASSYCVAEYGAQAEWLGAISGDREITKQVIKRSLDWTELRTFDPLRGKTGKYLEALQLIADGLKSEAEEVPIIAAVFSPLAQAAKLAGKELLIRHMRTQQDRLRSGLNILTENTLRLIEALRQRTSISGVFYVLRYASYDEMAQVEYESFGVPYDHKILEALAEKWWLNIVHLQGDMPMFELVRNYPVQILNWHDQGGRPDLTTGKALFSGAVCGGLSQLEHLQYGTPTTVSNAAREAMRQTGSRRMILSAGGGAPVTTPLSNIRAMRSAVEMGVT